MIFLDTSAIFASVDLTDANHSTAKNLFRSALHAGETFLLHNYVVIESVALLQRRIGLNASLRFLQEARAFEIRWVDQDTHEAAVLLLKQKGRRDLSLVDLVSFIVMRREGVSHFLGFDEHFEDEGFVPYSGPGS